MDEIQQVKVNRNGSVHLPAKVREAAGFKAGDLLEVSVNDGSIELVKPEPEYHFAKWRSISHGLIVEKQQRAV